MRGNVGIVIGLLLLGLSGQSEAGTSPTLMPGAVEVGVGGSMTTVEGIASGSILLAGGYFMDIHSGLLSLESEVGFRHVESFSQTDVGLNVSWQGRFQHSSSYPYLGIGIGVRHEQVGSFNHTRYPAGFSVGVRSLMGQRGGFRAEYRFRRVLNDPIADFSEHQILLGVALYFRNSFEAGGSDE